MVLADVATFMDAIGINLITWLEYGLVFFVVGWALGIFGKVVEKKI